MHELLLQGGEERFGDGVVVGAAFGAHRDRDPGVAGFLTERQRDELGGFNWSSQHLDVRSCDGQAGWVDEGVDGALGDEVAGQAFAST
jgi:hypothetical protein